LGATDKDVAELKAMINGDKSGARWCGLVTSQTSQLVKLVIVPLICVIAAVLGVKLP